jgi:hypothetical protein
MEWCPECHPAGSCSPLNSCGVVEQRVIAVLRNRMEHGIPCLDRVALGLGSAAAGKDEERKVPADQQSTAAEAFSCSRIDELLTPTGPRTFRSRFLHWSASALFFM